MNITFIRFGNLVTEAKALSPETSRREMPDYRAYVVDVEGHIKTFEVVTAPDDAAAIEAAQPLVDGHDIEIWHLDRKVAVLPRQN